VPTKFSDELLAVTAVFLVLTAAFGLVSCAMTFRSTPAKINTNDSCANSLHQRSAFMSGPLVALPSEATRSANELKQF
jgi:hypothetical protein